jgi:acyl carrier protein
MTRDEAQTAVLEAIRRIVPDADFETLTPDDKLREKFELDSLDFMSFVEFLSARSGLPIPEDDYERLVSLSSCIDYLSGAPEQ